MTTLKRRLPIAFLLGTIMLVIAMLLCGTVPADSIGEGDTEYRLTGSDKDDMTEIYKKGEACEYVIIVSSGDDITADTTLARDVQNLVAMLGGEIFWTVDATSTEQQKELLLGNTDRALSRLAAEAIDREEYGDALVWCIYEQDGKVAYTANSNEAFVRGSADLLKYASDDGFAVPMGAEEIHVLSRSEYEQELENEKEMERLERIEELKSLIADFKYSDFGDAPTTSMEGSTFGAPNLYPTVGEHPRLNVTADKIPSIKEYMESEEAKYTSFYFWKLADTAYDGKLPPATYHPEGTRIGMFNMDEQGLAIIEAKAFAYLLTGNELYAYEAIYAMKNYLTTIDIQWIHSDQCREFGRIIYCTAIVYDWCYPLLTDDDKDQFRMAVADIGSSENQNTDFGNQMEVGFPPVRGTVVSSHSSEHQVLRDYLSIAIAVFDEDPTWYEWVGGMIYNYYVPFREYYFRSGTYPQGVNIYAPHRFDADLWGVWMLYCAVGENPYGDYLRDVTHSFFVQACSDGSLFSTGDGARPSSAAEFWHHALITAALYGDDVMRAEAAKFSGGFNGYDGYSLKFSFTQMLILSAAYVDKTGSNEYSDDVYKGQSPVNYLGSPLGQITARERWNDENAAAVFMRIGERTTANHEHEDAGTFQIYYKGLYTGDSGEYAGYASTHWYYYSSTTIAHNGLLVSNPARIGDNPEAPASYFYSGSQRKMAEASTLDQWLETAGYKTGEVTGAAWGYKSDGTTDYAYIGGDITAAYNTADVAYVGRNMLTYYTGNEDAPMYLVVFDKITSFAPEYKKTFLLHTTNEPVIDTENRTVVSTQGGGRLVLRSLLGGDNIEAIGGEGRDYLINGRQCDSMTEDRVMTEWGRVEISPNSDALTHKLLNFMYVTDSDSTLMLEPELIETENAAGVLIGKNVFMFADTEGERNTEPIKFKIDGKGLYRFIITGLYAGTWDILVDGVSVAHAVSSEEGSVISFYAPAGEVSVMPGRDIVPSNGGRIIYNTFGGIVPEDAPIVYEVGVPVTLPERVDNGCNTFIGWYTSPDFSEDSRVTELIAEEKGNIHVFAKYAGIIIDETYEGDTIASSRLTYDGIVYNGKAESYFETVKTETNTYMRMTKGTSDPNVDVALSPTPYLYSGKKITLSIDLAREAAPVIQGICRIRGLMGSNDTFPYFTTTSSGLVLLGGSVAVMDLTSQFQTLAVTLDFETGTATAYDRDGNVLGTVQFSAPEASGCDNTADWLNSISSVVNWWMGGGETLLIDNFTVYAGDYVPKPVVLPEGYSAITYKTNGGLFVSSPATYYKEGELTLLEPNITKGQDEFLGWYTTPDFLEGTRIVEISPDMTGEVVVYAKWAGKILNVDFEGKDVLYEKEVGTVGGLEYNGTTSNGAYFKTEKDAAGNTYAHWYRGSGDPQIKYNGKVDTFSGRHVVTYAVSLATVEGETPMAFSFNIRSTRAISSTNAGNRICLFSTDTAGKVYLGGSIHIATLSPDSFTDIVVSIDFENSLIIAYNSADASVISSVAFELDNYTEWLDVMNLLLYGYANGGESIRIDNLSITSAPYSIGGGEDIPESSLGKIDYILNGGSFTSSAPSHYVKGEQLELPVPTRNGAVFLGWYKDERLTMPITEITPDDTDNFVLYAKWQTKVFELSGDAYPDLDVQGKTNGAGANNQIGDVNFQTQGYNGCYTTVTDTNGEKYILWKKGTRDPQLIYGGNLAAKAGGNLVLTFNFTMAKNGDDPIISMVGRMRTPKIDGVRRELHLVTVDEIGNVYLGGDRTIKIGEFTGEFKTIGVVADFASEKLYGYNENGELVAERQMIVPSPYNDGVEFYNAIAEDILGFYAGGTEERSIRIKSVTIVTGNSYTEG